MADFRNIGSQQEYCTEINLYESARILWNLWTFVLGQALKLAHQKNMLLPLPIQIMLIIQNMYGKFEYLQCFNQNFVSHLYQSVS